MKHFIAYKNIYNYVYQHTYCVLQYYIISHFFKKAEINKIIRKSTVTFNFHNYLKMVTYYNN